MQIFILNPAMSINYFCSCMIERFEATTEQDLFNKILQDPQYEINRNDALDSFIETLNTSHNLECSVCFRPILKMAAFYKQQTHCLACFCKEYEEGQSFLTVDLSRKLKEQSKWSLFQQWQMVNAMSKLGADDYQAITKRLQFTVDEHLIQEYQKSFLQYRQNQTTIKDPPTLEKIYPHKEMYENFNSSLFSQCNVLDYMIANIHEKSQTKHVKKLLQYKRSQDKMTQKMRQEFEKLAEEYQKNIQHPQQYEEMDEEMSMPYLQIGYKTNEEELLQCTAKLLAQTDDLIKKNMHLQYDQDKKSLKTSSNFEESTKKKHFIKKQIKKQRKIMEQLSKKPIKMQMKA